MAGLALSAVGLGAQAVTIHEEMRTFPTYDVGEPNPNPQFDAFYREPFPNYPYLTVKPLNKTRSQVEWRVIVLENEYLTCRILPDLGGHVHGCTDKVAGKEIFFANPAIRKTAEQGRGGFISTGIETSFPIAHSRMSGWPVDCAWSVKDGVGRVVVEDTDRVSGMEWRVEFILRPGERMLEQKGTIYNGSAARRGYQWWVNAAVEVDDPHLRILYPTHWMLPHGDGPMTPWPIGNNGGDLSDVANHKDAVGLFSHLSHEPWIAVYKPKSRSGVAHFADASSVKGKKIWIWGSNNDKLFRTTYTEGANPPVEMQAGEMETQPEFAFLVPGQSKTFEHYWIPFSDLGGVSRVTRDVVLNVSRNGSKATVELQATHLMKDVTLRFRDGTNVVGQEKVTLDPKTTYAHSVEAQKLTVELLLDPNGQPVLRQTENEFDAEPFDGNAKNPEPVAPAGNSDEPGPTLERGLYNEQRDQWVFVWGDYDRGMQKTPGNAALAVAKGRAAVALNRYEDAIALLKDQTRSSGEAAYYYGIAAANLPGHAVDGEEALQRATQDRAYGPAAQIQLVFLDAREKGAGGVQQAYLKLQSLLAGPGSAPSLGAIEVALLRRSGHRDDAKKRLDYWLDIDPANSMLRLEGIFLSGSDDGALWRHLAGDSERVLALAEQYRKVGAYDDALKVLEHPYKLPPANERALGAVTPQDNPLVEYFRAYCRLQLHQDATISLATASALPVLGIFPHRTIDYEILQTVLAQNANDEVAHDLMGELYFDSFRVKDAIREWQSARKIRPDLTALQRNLGLAILNFGDDPKQAGPVLAEGLRFAPDDSELTAALARAGYKAPAAAAPGEGSSSIIPTGVAETVNLAGKSVADSALIQSVSDSGTAVSKFTAKNFPKEKQPDSVMQAYIEVQLRRVLDTAKSGHCEDALTALENLGAIDKQLFLTNGSFSKYMKQPHFQYYMAFVHFRCGEAKKAEKMWAKISKDEALANDSPDFVYPLLASWRLKEADAGPRIEAALKTLGDPGKGNATGLVKFEMGALLLASGHGEQGNTLLEDAAQNGEALVQYLSLALLAEGRL